MSLKRQPDPARPTLRLGFFLAALVILMAAANSALGAEGRWELAIGTAAATPGAAVELPVVLTSNGASVGAIAFTVEFDSSKLALDGGPTLGSKVEMPAPTMFTSSSWVGTEAGAIGVVVYDSVRPIGVLADGPIARIRFRVLPDASGVAEVRVSASRPFSAAGARGEALEGDIAAPGGVTIVTSTGSALSPVRTSDPAAPRERLAARAGGSDEGMARVTPLLSTRGGDEATPPPSLTLHNRGEEAVTARLALLRDDGRGEAGPVEVIVPAGATRVWNAAAELFGTPEASGAITVESAGDLMIAATSGETGQIIAVEPSTDEVRIFAVDDLDGGRGVLAIANVGAEKEDFTVEVRDAEGALLDVRSLDIAARSTREVALRSDGLPAVAGLTILIRSDGARFSAWSVTVARDDGARVVRIAR